MKLWIAEKPDMGRKIAKALGGGSERNGMIDVGGGNVVTWAIGHLLEDYMPHEYDDRFRKWNLADLPIIPKRFQNKPQEGKTAQLKVVVGLIKKAKSIVIATDAGREGEAIAWKILDHAGWKGGAQRLWASSVSEANLKKEVGKLIDDSQKKSLYIAAKLRGAMDWSDGINFSRLYNLRLNNYGDRPLSLGRVQTATLAILVDRDNEIANFKPSNYYEFTAPITTDTGTFDLKHKPSEKNRVLDKRDAEDLAKRTSGQPCTLKVETKPLKIRPPAPFSLPELQMACSSKWGWSAKKTLDETQKLYEAGLITYPRTDSSCLTTDLKNDVPAHLASLRSHPDFRELANIKPLYRKSVFNDAKVEDHHGIIPTDQRCDPRKLDQAGERLFDLIARRFIACLMPDAEARQTTISTMLDGVSFRTGGRIMDKLGWKAVWKGQDDPSEKKKDDDEEGGELPPVKDGQSGKSGKVKVDEKTTKAPPHYTEGTLLKAMFSAGSKDPNLEIRDLLSNAGLGTGATRQEIIEKLKYRDFARLQGKKIISTERARAFVSILREESSRLVDVVATADLERRLREVEKDPSNMPDIWKEYIRNLHDDIDQLRNRRPSRKLPPSPSTGSSGAKGGGKKGYSKGKGKGNYKKKTNANRTSSKEGARSSSRRTYKKRAPAK